MTDEKKQPEKKVEEVKEPRYIVFSVKPGQYGIKGQKL